MVAWGGNFVEQLICGSFFLILTLWLGNIRWKQRNHEFWSKKVL